MPPRSNQPSVLRRDHPVPLYQQLTTALCAQLESGRYAERQRLPSERELVAQFGVSCMTVRRALVALIQEGLIYGQARKGTFICVPKLDQQFFSENLPIEYVRSQYRGERYEFTAMVTTTR